MFDDIRLKKAQSVQKIVFLSLSNQSDSPVPSIKFVIWTMICTMLHLDLGNIFSHIFILSWLFESTPGLCCPLHLAHPGIPIHLAHPHSNQFRGLYFPESRPIGFPWGLQSGMSRKNLEN